VVARDANVTNMAHITYDSTGMIFVVQFLVNATTQGMWVDPTLNVLYFGQDTTPKYVRSINMSESSLVVLDRFAGQPTFATTQL